MYHVAVGAAIINVLVSPDKKNNAIENNNEINYAY